MKAVTAYPEAERELADQVRRAEIDHEALNIPLRRCELSVCRATCCHDGVVLGCDEKAVIEGLEAEKRDELHAYGWEQEDCLVRDGDRWKSRTVGAGDGEFADDFPAHFAKTRCVFLDSEHRCVWQRLAADENRHPWFWKPISCWMHPLLLKRGERPGLPPLLTILQPEEGALSRAGSAGFAPFTPCGKEASSGPPAWRTLREELDFLGEIGGRNLIKEVSGGS